MVKVQIGIDTGGLFGRCLGVLDGCVSKSTLSALGLGVGFLSKYGKVLCTLRFGRLYSRLLWRINYWVYILLVDCSARLLQRWRLRWTIIVCEYVAVIPEY